MESFFSQTWEDKEYIVIDGGSTDGTVDIIREYSSLLAYWCSEMDNGIYDAMNKGIAHATGDWINFLNCGDIYSNHNALSTLVSNGDHADIIYGNSIEITNDHQIAVEASDDIALMEHTPIYRHGASIVKTSVQRLFLFNTSRKEELGYSLDWLCIFSMYKQGYSFKKVPTYVQTYRREGASNNALKTIKYIYKITSQGKFSFSKALFAAQKVLLYYVQKSSLYRWTSALMLEYMVNDILPHIPFHKGI